MREKDVWTQRAKKMFATTDKLMNQCRESMNQTRRKNKTRIRTTKKMSRITCGWHRQNQEPKTEEEVWRMRSSWNEERKAHTLSACDMVFTVSRGCRRNPTLAPASPPDSPDTTANKNFLMGHIRRTDQVIFRTFYDADSQARATPSRIHS